MIALLLGLALAGTTRLGVFVGANDGMGDEPALAFAEGEAREMARVFQDMGGFERDDVTVLQNLTAAQLREVMRQVDARAREVRVRGDDVLLVFTYSGHAGRDGLHLAGTVLPLEDLRRWLEESPARVRVAFVDACESGALARGGTPTEAIEITVDDTLTASGVAIVTSTGPLSAARESAEFGGGVFTRALLNGLRGTADTDGDGVITLDEAYRHAFESTVVGTARSTSGVQRPVYAYAISGVGQVVLTRVPTRAATVVLPADAEGVYAIVSVASGQVVARVDKIPGEARRIALPTGRYVVRKVRRSDVLVGELDLVWGGDRSVEDDQLEAVALGDPLARGGWRERTTAVALHTLGGTPTARGHPFELGGDLELRRALRPRLQGLVGLGGSTGARKEELGSLWVTRGSLGAGLAFVRPLRHLDLAVTTGLSALLLRQDLLWRVTDAAGRAGEEDEWHMVGAPAGWLGGRVRVPLGTTVGVEAEARGLLVGALVDYTVALHPVGELRVGASFELR